MRKITSEAKKAFEGGYNYKNTNTVVFSKGLYLFGHKIADNADGLEITNCGYFTATTKERLNALEGVNIIQRAGEWYLNGKIWGGEWIKIVTE